MLDALSRIIRDRIAVPLAGSLFYQLPQVRTLGVAVRNGEDREQDVPELEFNVGPIGDPEGIGNGPREAFFGK